jgi:DedD protein
MDPQLKQRLIGVTVIVALIVIFVPMFFEKTDGSHPAKTLGGIPPIPDEVRESTLELPKTAEDVTPQAEGKKSDSAHAASSPSGYTVIPLSDPEPAQKETATKSSAQKAPLPAPVEISEEEPFEETAPAQPATPVSSGKQNKTTGNAKGQGKPRAVPAAPAGSVVVMDDEPDGAPVASAQGASTSASTSGSKSTVSQPKPSNVVKPASTPAPAQKSKVVDEASLPVAAPAAKPSAPAVKPPAVTAPAVKPSTVATPVAVKPSAPKTAAAPKPVVDATVSTIAQTAAKPAAASKAEAVSAWVVQTGSFTTEDNAKALVERLRQAKFAAFVEAVQGDSGSVYRVQVGPELDRAHAEQVQKQIEGSVGLKGIVLPHR